MTSTNQSNEKIYQLNNNNNNHNNNNNVTIKSRDFIKINDLDAFDLKHVLAKTNFVFLQPNNNNNNNNNNCISSLNGLPIAAAASDVLTATTTTTSTTLSTAQILNVTTAAMNTTTVDITDLRHESLNHILKNNMEIINKQHSNTIDLKPIIHLNANNNDNNNSNAIENIDEDNNNHILMVDNMVNTSESNKADNVDDQFSHLIDEEQHNCDQDDDKVSFLFKTKSFNINFNTILI